jgi:alcohol dehydrogenase class IV
MVPQLVLIDPELCVSVPAATTAWTGMDAITQLIESYISRFARPIPQALALEGLRRAVPSLAEAVRDGSSRAARENMSHAALLSGIALANSGLGLAHGVAAALGVHARAAHGLACAVMLPTALRVNRQVSCNQLAALARVVLGGNHRSDEAAADAFIDKIDELCATVNVPRNLSSLGVGKDQIPAIVAGSRGNSMNGNPRDVSDEELTSRLEQIF